MNNLFGGLFSSLGASSNFEKHRLQFTNKNDLETPNEHALAKMMETFDGKDQETRAQIGFAIIIRKINNSDSNTSWVYLLKNLMILDFTLERKRFIEELRELQLPILNEFKEQSRKYAQFNFDGLIRKYFKLIKIRAECLSRKISLYNIDRYQRQEFLEKMNIQDCDWHIDMSERLFQAINDLIQYKRYGITQFKIIQWLFLQLLYKLVNIYSTELIAITRILSFLQIESQQFIIDFKKHVLLFNKNANAIIMFANEFKWIKGFETINYQEFDPSKNEILSYVQEALMHKKNEEEELKVKIEQIHAEQKITVNRKPREQRDFDSDRPPKCRIHFANEKKPKKQFFQSYMNFYSEDWPPKDIITIDMIEIMRQEQQSEQLIAVDDIPSDRQMMLSNYDHRDTGSEPVVVEYHLIDVKTQPFINIFSNLEGEWQSTTN